jgi:hypothetical protein
MELTTKVATRGGWKSCQCLTDDAVHDLRSIKTFISEDDAIAVGREIERVRKTVILLAILPSPHSGPRDRYSSLGNCVMGRRRVVMDVGRVCEKPFIPVVNELASRSSAIIEARSFLAKNISKMLQGVELLPSE